MHISAIHIPSDELSALYDLAEQCLPNESVALLFGVLKDRIAIVTSVEPMKNIANSPTRFEVDPAAEYELLIRAEQQKIELVGIFHSHPAPPRPSTTDMTYMKLNPVVWIIASNLTGAWISNAFHFTDTIVVEIPCITT
ncbi:MAG: M67 family metallopeptidase [Candidatus Thorarchaeota archaeon]|nr:M67 family metallopeptidase [Candidatus Thorarchaeota archaeon]